MASEGRFELDPKEISRAAFPAAFRGYDQDSVRHYLTRLAQAVARAQQRGLFGAVDGAVEEADARAAQFEREAHELRQQVAELEGRLAAGFAAPEPQPAEVLPQELDESELIALLGRETARVLETARSAAADTMAKAQSEAEEIRIAAQSEVEVCRREAEMALTAARAEGQRMREDVADEVRRQQDSLRAEAERAEQENRGRVDQILAEAAAKGEGLLAKARQQANRLVSDAETLREEILTDLLQRRRVNQEHLNRLIAARAALADALTVAQAKIDAVAGEIKAAEPDEAEIDLTLPDTTVSTSELDELRARLGDASSTAEYPVGVGKLGSASDGGNGDSGATSPTLGDNSIGGSTGDTPTVVPAWSTAPLDAQAPDVSSGASTTVTQAPDGYQRIQDVAVTGQLVAGSVGVGSGVVTSDRQLGVDTDQGGHVAVVDRFHEQHLDAGGGSNGAAGVWSTPYGSSATTTNDVDVWAPEVPETDIPIEAYTDVFARDIDLETTPLLGKDPASLRNRSTNRGDLPRDTPFTGHLPLGFESRDIAMARSTPGFKRRLKRAVNDDQSHVLDRIRAGSGTVTASELPPVAEQLEGYLSSLRPALLDVVKSGGELLGSVDVPYQAVENLSLQLAKHLVDCVRQPTVQAIDQAATTDREAIMDPIRATYRDFRNTVLPDLIDDALHEAFSMGLFHGIGDDDEVLWMVDPRLDSDPICEENSAAPAMVKGSVFPSGHVRPLSMPGCRCLVLPAR